MSRQRPGRLHKIHLVACELLEESRWSLPVIEPSHLPYPAALSLPPPRAPIYPRLPRKVRLVPLDSAENTASLLNEHLYCN